MMNEIEKLRAGGIQVLVELLPDDESHARLELKGDVERSFVSFVASDSKDIQLGYR